MSELSLGFPLEKFCLPRNGREGAIKKTLFGCNGLALNFFLMKGSNPPQRNSILTTLERFYLLDACDHDKILEKSVSVPVAGQQGGLPVHKIA